MQKENHPRWTRRYGIAVLSFALAFGLTLLLWPIKEKGIFILDAIEEFVRARGREPTNHLIISLNKMIVFKTGWLVGGKWANMRRRYGKVDLKYS